MPSSEDRYCKVVTRSFRSSSGSWLSSQYLKTSASTDTWVSLRSSTLPSRTGPNEWTVARTCAPFWPVSDRNSTGWPCGWKGRPSDCMRSMTLGFVASPGAAMPVRSPLMSATKQGTPARDSWPAMSCSVLVLPVPVAPAIRPWRFSIDSATCTKAASVGWSSIIGRPYTRPGSVSVYPSAMALSNSVFTEQI